VSILSGSQVGLLLLIGRSAQFIWGFLAGGMGGGLKLFRHPLEKHYWMPYIGKTPEFPVEAFRSGDLIVNTICHISISLTFVEYHKARPLERSSYWSIIYSWCILFYILHVICSHLSFVLFSNFQASYKFDPELFLNSESQPKFLERNKKIWNKK
jgi:hypothetical protein